MKQSDKGIRIKGNSEMNLRGIIYS